MDPNHNQIRIYIDADACPVREECYKVAARHNVSVFVVSNHFLRVPREPWIKFIAVSDEFDAADNYITEQVGARSVVITADILLAERCLAKDAIVIDAKGVCFTVDSIGSAIATRAIMADLRAGALTPNLGGPAPFRSRDRSRFLQTLHQSLVDLARSS